MSAENNGETAKTVGRPFKPGQSGNPGGRPKIADVFKLGCRRVVDELVLERWRDEVEKLGDNWVKCSELLAAYGYGKPHQSSSVEVDVNAERPLAEVPQERLQAFFRAKK